MARFPILELFLALLAFQAFSLQDSGGSITGPARVDDSELALPAFLNVLRSLKEVFFPVAAFVVVVSAMAFTLEDETGVLRGMLSLPVSRRAVFAAKVTALLLFVWTCVSGSILFAAVARTWHHVGAVFTADQWTFVPGLFAAVFLLVLPLAGIGTLCAVLARSTALAIAGGMVAAFAAFYAGQASRSGFLPPASLGDAGLLWLANPYGSGSQAIQVALAYASVGVMLLAFAAFLFRYREVGK